MGEASRGHEPVAKLGRTALESEEPHGARDAIRALIEAILLEPD